MGKLLTVEHPEPDAAAAEGDVEVEVDGVDDSAANMASARALLSRSAHPSTVLDSLVAACAVLLGERATATLIEIPADPWASITSVADGVFLVPVQEAREQVLRIWPERHAWLQVRYVRVVAAQVQADAAAISLLVDEAVAILRSEALRAELAAQRQRRADLTVRLAGNREIGVAVGILMSAVRCTLDEAVELMRRASRTTGRRMTDIAAEVTLTGTLDQPPQRIRMRDRFSVVESDCDLTGAQLDTLRHADVDSAAFAVDISTARDQVTLRLRGELDDAAAAHLTEILASIRTIPRPLLVDLSDLRFLDASGMEPLVACARRRIEQQLPPLRIGACRPPARHLLAVTGPREDPELDVRAGAHPVDPDASDRRQQLHPGPHPSAVAGSPPRGDPAQVAAAQARQTLPKVATRAGGGHLLAGQTRDISGLPETDVARVQRWCRARVPDELRGEVRIEADVAARHVTIVECRRPWRTDTGPEPTRFPMARLRHTKSTGLWSLYWCDRNRRFHKYDQAPANRSVADLLAEIDRDPNAIFWG